MTKVEINGKTYCVETLIYTVERLTKDVKASAECHRLMLELVLDSIKAEIEQLPSELTKDGRRMIRRRNVFQIIDKYKADTESEE